MNECAHKKDTHVKFKNLTWVSLQCKSIYLVNHPNALSAINAPIPFSNNKSAL